MRARLSSLVIKLLYYVLILSAILFTMFLYSDDYEVFPWATKDEGLKFLHLIITIPVPLFPAFILNKMYNQRKSGIHNLLINQLPILCFLFISVFMLSNMNLNRLKLKIGFGLAIFLFLLTIYLMLYDFLKKEEN